MKCHCPACGRTTEIDPISLDFFGRCVRCGALLKAQLQEEEGAAAVAVRVINPGRVRESQSSTGQIADLLSRPLPPKKTAAPMPPPQPLGEPLAIPETIPPQEDTEAHKDLYTLAPPTVIRPITTVADIHVAQELPPKYRRRFAVRERQQMLGMVTVFGIGMSALIAVGAIALKSRDFFIKSAHARTNDTVQPAATPPQTPAQTPSATPDATDAQPTDTPTQTPQFTVGDHPTANPAADNPAP